MSFPNVQSGSNVEKGLRGLDLNASAVVDKTFDSFKARVLAGLPEYTNSQERYYRRQKLMSVSEESKNPPIGLDKPPQGIERFAAGAVFYPFNAESVRDHGWGCAWRAIQTSLSSYGIKTSFSDLFILFGSKQNLQTIYHDKYPFEQVNSSKPFAPFELEEGWAEPFIGEMVMHFYGIPASLESLNGIPVTCNAPPSVFHRAPMTFTAFVERLQKHFDREHAAPVMIDDSSLAFNIIGIGGKDADITLWIADAHIKEGANRSQSEKTPNGLFTITLNGRGEQIRCSLNGEDQHQKSYMDNLDYSKRLYFNNKRWMVLFPLKG